MSTIQIQVAARDLKTEERWVSELSTALRGLSEARYTCASAAKESDDAQIVFVDAETPALDTALERVSGRAVFLIVKEGLPPPRALLEGTVDDVLVWPFRPVEALSKLRHYQQLLLWDEVRSLNSSFAEVMEKFHEDLRLAERLQKSKLPARFPETKGFKTASRYLAGMKSGGDHFDLAEAKDGSQLSVVLSDSSSYGLSSAVLAVLMRVAVKLSAEDSRSCRETVRRIQEELLLTLNDKDKLSLFYGVVSRRDFKLRYLNLGTSLAYYAPPKSPFRLLPVQGGSISRQAPMGEMEESALTLDPEGRIALLSDGFVEGAGSPEEVAKVLDRFRDQDPKDALNELVFRVKSKFTEPDDIPPQDCTAVIFDVDPRIMRVV